MSGDTVSFLLRSFGDNVVVGAQFLATLELRRGHRGHDHGRDQDREPRHWRRFRIDQVVNIGSATAGAGGTTVVSTPTVTFANAVTQVGKPQANLTAQLLGLGGATADSYNRLSINTPAVLLNNAGAGI